jgi:obg-like ATPase 1
VYLVNLSKADYTRKKNKWLAKIHAWVQAHGAGQIIPFSIEFESQVWQLRTDPAAQVSSHAIYITL